MYDWQFSEPAKAQLLHLPYEAIDDLVATIAQACVDPWNFQRRDDEQLNRHFAHRWVLTAGGEAKVWFLIRDDQGLLWVTAIEWQG